MVGKEGGRLDAPPRYENKNRRGGDFANAHASDTGEPVLLPFRMSCYVLSNLVVTAGMLTPGLQVRRSPFQPGTDQG